MQAATISFGSWSTTLGLAAGFGVLVAGLLSFGPGNRAANRWLAALVIVVVLRLMPYVIGYAGFYDVYPWLSFLPFDLSFALGPLLWLHVVRLTGPKLPNNWAIHLIPAAIQFAYYVIIFSKPLAWKNAWDTTPHAPLIEPVETWLSLLSFAVYLGHAARRYRHYQVWLAANVSDRDEHRQPWIRNALIALGLTLAVLIGFEGYALAVAPLTYFDRFPLYLFLSALVLYLGLEGWRHATHRFPAMVTTSESSVVPTRDWAAQGADWARRIEADGWWREPQLSLAEVARRLGTNQSYVSRALNDGLGVNFNALINRMRVTGVQTTIRSSTPDVDLLSIALEAGFSSKASFNRAFRDHAGVTPSEFRKSQIR